MEKEKGKGKAKEPGPCGICKEMGHWVRSCPLFTPPSFASQSVPEMTSPLFRPVSRPVPPHLFASTSNASPVPEMMCLCGAGRCLVTSSPSGDRLCYICPLTPENKGCGNTQLCDYEGTPPIPESAANEGTPPVTQSEANEGTPSVPQSASNEEDTLPFPRRLCVCRAGPCLVLKSNTPNNPGRLFFSCPANPGPKCIFFQWCDSPPTICYLCEMEGHWAYNCPYVDSSESRQNICFYCKKPGHWAHNCPFKHWRRNR